MLGGADNPNGELLSYIIGADSMSHRFTAVAEMGIQYAASFWSFCLSSASNSAVFSGLNFQLSR